MVERNLIEVIKSMLTVTLQLPGWEKKRILIYFPGGSLRGIHTTAMATALATLNLLSNTFYFLGNSVGAIIATYATEGVQGLQRGARLFFDEALSKKQTKLWRFWRVMDVKQTINAMINRASSKYVGNKAFSEKNNLYVTAMDKSGLLYIINPANADPCPSEAIRASISMQGICGQMVEVNGTKLFDAGGVSALPLEEMILQFQPTDVLILSNRPSKRATAGRKTPWWLKLYGLILTFLKHGFTPVTKKLAKSNDGWKEGLEYARKIKESGHPNKVNIAILNPADINIPAILPDTQKSKDLLEGAFQATFNATETLISFALKMAKEEMLAEIFLTEDQTIERSVTAPKQPEEEPSKKKYDIEEEVSGEDFWGLQFQRLTLDPAVPIDHDCT
ncbi:MAG: hypothetical protein WC449_03450 [Candidatus Paceibacterota bacterium]